MNIVFLSPHFPGNNYHFCANLHKLGATVLAIADEKYENLHHDLKSVLTEYYHVNDMHDYDQLVRAMGYFTHKYGKIDCFESHNEYWLETDVRIRTDFNISGIKNDGIKQLKQKSVMNKKFIKAGVAVLPGKVVHTLKEATTFIKKIGYPVIAKPDAQVGVSSYKIYNQQDLIAFLASNPSAEYFIERFISGKKYTFDGLVDRDGKLVFYTSHTFSEDAIKAVNDGLNKSFYSLRDIPKNLEEAGINTLKVFDIRQGFFHFEFIITPEDQVIGLDVNTLPPDALTMDMFNFANDVDLYYEWGNIVMNGSTTIDYNRKYHCAYIGRKATNNYVHSHEIIKKKFDQFIVQDTPVSDTLSAELDNYGYLARAQELDDILEIIDFIQAKK